MRTSSDSLVCFKTLLIFCKSSCHNELIGFCISTTTKRGKKCDQYQFFGLICIQSYKTKGKQCHHFLKYSKFYFFSYRYSTGTLCKIHCEKLLDLVLRMHRQSFQFNRLLSLINRLISFLNKKEQDLILQKYLGNIFLVRLFFKNCI